MAFVEIQSPPPKNGQYFEIYNELVRHCQLRGFGDGLPQKEMGDAIEQSDLNAIRGAILGALDFPFFDPALMTGENMELNDPFREAKPQINGGKGFLLMPGAYTSTGAAIYSQGALGGVPVLWEHFVDLANVLMSLRSRVYDYRLTVNAEPTDMTAEVEFLLGGDDLEESHDFQPNRDDWELEYEVPYSTAGADEIKYGLYYRLDADRWAVLGNGEDLARADLLNLDVRKAGGALANLYALGTSAAAEWEGRCIVQPVIHVLYKIELEQPNGYPKDDRATNDVVEAGGCEPCRTNAQCSVRSMLDDPSKHWGTLLARSSGDEPLQISHYMDTYGFLGTTYGQYNCDTAIEDTFGGGGADENGNQATWHFCYIRRPSGVLVRFWSWSDKEVMFPANGHNYFIWKEGNSYHLYFPADGITHVFGGGSLSYCYRNGDEGLTNSPPGENVERQKVSSSYYKFNSPLVGPMAMTVNAHGVPTIWRDTVQSRSASPYDEIAEIRPSEDFSAAAGYDFAAFFAPGEMPDFGEPVRCEVIDFLNASEQLISKYIEFTYDTGHLNRGYWNREGGAVLPAELAMFDRVAVEDDEAEEEQELYLQIRTQIKYGTNGRSEATRHELIRRFPGFDLTVAEYRHYGTPEEQAAVYEYDENPGSGSYGKLLFSTDFNGGWHRYEYDGYGRLAKEISPFGDSAPEEADADHTVRLYSYAPLRPDENTWEADSRVRTVVTETLGVETAREYHLYFTSETWNIVAAAPGAAWDADGNRVSKSFTYPAGDFAGRAWKSENADGTKSLTTYLRTGDELATTTESGFLPGHGTRTVTVTDARNFVVSRREYDIESGLLIAGSDYVRDRYGRALRETAVDGDVTETEYNCCGPRFVTDPAGTVTEYAYDPFNRMKFGSVAGVTTYHAYDANDNEVETTVAGKEGGELTSTFEYDIDGLLVSETDAGGATTLYRRGPGWEETENALGGIVRTEYYRSGEVKAVSGSAATPMTYEYGVEDGELYTKALASETEWTKVHTDFLGRQYRTVYPDGFSETTFYDAFGRVARTENSLGSIVLTVYDEASGKLQYRALKRTPGTQIDFSQDLVTAYEQGYELRDDAVLRTQLEYLYPAGGKSGESVRRDGKYRLSRSDGRKTVSTTEYPGDGEVVERTVGFDGVTVTQTAQDGILLRTDHSVLGETLYSYDEFNRSTGRTHAGLSEENTLDMMGRVLVVTQTGGNESRTTSYGYDLLGRQLSTTTPEGITTEYAYTPRHEVASVSGGVYRQEYAYDSQSRLLTLTTYQDADTPQETAFAYDNRGRMVEKTYADDSSELWSYRGDGKVATYTNVREDLFTYRYDLAGELVEVAGAGLAISYDGYGRAGSLTDRAGTRTFTYDPYGKVRRETAPQLPDTALRRSYDDGERLAGFGLGESKVTYICYYTGTPRGIRRITEHETGTRLEFAVGAWEDREILAYQPPNTTITLGNITYDDFGRTSDDPDFGSHFAKPAPYLIETRENAVLGYRYVYGADGRLDAIECGGARLEYDYWPETNLISQARWRNQGEAAPFLAVNRYYDDYRRLYRIDLDSTQIIGYQLNDDDQRIRTQLPDASVWDYTYDMLGQLTEAERSPVPDSRIYAYDGIGNRTEAEEDGAATTYAANLLNQYTAVNAEEPAYDADGNLLTWNGWTYTWNSENRLVAMEKGDIRVEADYDYMGRRFEKKVYENNALVKHQKFVYDGYKLIAIYDALNDNALETTFLWQPDTVGLDVPLAMTIGGETYYYVTDGNKNVIGLYDSSGIQVASYVYGPFGQTLEADGSMAEANPFRFSSEYHDDETGLVYYNYRYYSPGLGRWMSRDPIGEEGGFNLYGIGYNDFICNADYWGLKDYKLGDDDPVIKTDPGAGLWGVEKKTFRMQALRLAILADEGSILYPDAMAHLKYYLNNTGNDYTIRFQKMINDLESLRKIREKEISLARIFVETLQDGIYDITSGSPSGGYANKAESGNWFYAVGGYSVWGKGKVRVFGNEKCFELKYEFKFFDRYNWDKGKKVKIAGFVITDDFMGLFHRQGLAREFNMYGSIKQTIRWNRGDKNAQISDGWEEEKKTK